MKKHKLINTKHLSKKYLLLQCIDQLHHVSLIYDTPVLDSTKMLVRDIRRKLNICHHAGTYATKINARGVIVCCKCKNPIVK